MRWGTHVELDHLDNVEDFLPLISQHAQRSVDAGLLEFDAAKPFRLGWFIEQD